MGVARSPQKPMKVALGGGALPFDDPLDSKSGAFNREPRGVIYSFPKRELASPKKNIAPAAHKIYPTRCGLFFQMSDFTVSRGICYFGISHVHAPCCFAPPPVGGNGTSNQLENPRQGVPFRGLPPIAKGVGVVVEGA